MGIFRSSESEPDDSEEEEEGLPGHMVHVAVGFEIEDRTREINSDIEHINDIYRYQLPVISEQPYLSELESLDEKIDNRYEEISRKYSEQYPERKRLIVLRQRLQELLEMYMTYRPLVSFGDDTDA